MGKKRKNIKLIHELKKDIEQIEKDIKNIKFCNQKIKLLKLYKIILKYIQLISPYFITTAITFSVASKIGITPFITDKTKQELEIMKEFDTNGNIRYEEQYENYNQNNQIRHYSKWEKIEDNLYQRNIKTYSFYNLDEKKICELINNKNINSIKDILGDPIFTTYETRNNLSEIEFANNESIKATIYNTDTNNIILINEKIEENAVSTIAWIVLTIWCYTGIHKLRKVFSTFDIDEEIDKIKDRYPKVIKEDLLKKLEIKKATYNRLRR